MRSYHLISLRDFLHEFDEEDVSNRLKKNSSAPVIPTERISCIARP